MADATESSQGASGDLFDAIVMADERFRSDGFHEGWSFGEMQGLREGKHLGAIEGAKLASEVSYCHGFAATWKALLQMENTENPRTSRRLKVLDSLLLMICNFPLHDAANPLLQDHLEKIRGKFKQVCSLLGTQPSDDPAASSIAF
uniref:LTO1 maturation factor of ABCE1 n=1 Tax=Eptatretus burgeri TaxID=7764 RepID=A0A8C4NNB4_EPTBU